MKQSTILFETMPVGRIGIENDTERVVITSDYSCHIYLLEEYISYGIVKIMMPKSSPEVKMLDRMPILLRKRIEIIDDQNEIESLNRVLYSLRQDFGIVYDSPTENLKFPKGTSRKVIASVLAIHDSLKKLAIGFNHGIQISLSMPILKSSIMFLKLKAKNSDTRIILSEIEGILNQYVDLQIPGIQSPKQSTPYEIITFFDNLLNNEKYLEYSSQIEGLSLPETREGALLKLREISRAIADRKYFSAGWDYITKILKVFKIVELPESKIIAAMFNGRNLPIIHDMSEIKQNAINFWKVNAETNIPLSVDGEPIGKNIKWLPPLPSLKAGNNSRELSLGTLGDLKKALEVFDESREPTE